MPEPAPDLDPGFTGMTGRENFHKNILKKDQSILDSNDLAS
jgi:hypothetical protein